MIALRSGWTLSMLMLSSHIRRLALLVVIGVCVGCGCVADSSRPSGDDDRLAILLPATEKRFWEPIAQAFELAHPGVSIELIEGPQLTGLREDMYTASLLARDPSFDLVYMDVTWTPKFAAAGWLLPLDTIFGETERSALLSEALAAGVFDGALYRIPVRTDVGLLYYRRDWLEEAGVSVPQTLGEVVDAARRLQAPPERWGFVWPGKQYEGLVCFFLEILHGHGGYWIDPTTHEVGLDHDESVAALEFLNTCLSERPVSPPGVTTYQEEESRRIFHDGRAVFLRNWPYVWRLSQQEGSPLRGRIGVMSMPGKDHGFAAGTLGGWGLGVSVYSRNQALAVEFIRSVVTLPGQRLLCGPTGYAPSLRAAYEDSLLLAENPFLPTLLEAHEHAVLRPVIPGYALASDILQRQLSAALSGAKSAREAMTNAARETRLLLRESLSRAATDEAAE